MKKKTTKRNFRKLPKYALGTMKPYYDKGYQEASGIGNALFTTQPGVSLDPETQAIKQNALPKALQSVSMLAPFLTQMLTSSAPAVASGAAGASAINAAWKTAVLGGALQAFHSSVNALSPAVTANLGETGAKAAAGGTKGASGALGAAGTALGAIGSAYGLYTMGSQIADAGSHRTAADMMQNVGRQQYNTEYGNTYLRFTGPNASQELAYENASKNSKQLGFGINSIGTGAAIGGTLGSVGALGGSIGGPLGMALGAGLGLLVGGLGSLLGFGDNEDEVRKEIRLASDNINQYNREQEAVAKSKDVAAEFNNRIGSAAGGKSAYGPMKALLKYTSEKYNFNVNPDGTVSYGPTGSKITGLEVIGRPNGDTAIAPGDPAEGDVINSSQTEYDDSFVISLHNKYYPLAKTIAKDQIRLDNIIANATGPKELLEILIGEARKMKKINANKLMEIAKFNPSALLNKKYKCGKLPGYDPGKLGKPNWLDYAFPTTSGLFSLIGLNSERNRVKNATFPMFPGVPTNSGAVKGADLLGTRRYDERPEIDSIDKDVRYSLFNINRTGLNAGAKEAVKLATILAGNKAKGEVFAKANKANNEYIADYANAIRDYGNRMQDLMVANNAQRMALWQQQNAAKENMLALNTNSASNVIAALSKDLLGANQFHRAQDYQNRMLKLYGDNLDIEKTKVANDWLQNQELMRFRREQADREAAERVAASKPSPIIYQDYWRPGMDLEKAFSRNKLYVPKFNFSLG